MPQPRKQDFDDYVEMRWADGARPSEVTREIRDLAAGTGKLALHEKTVRRRFAELDEQAARDPNLRREAARFVWPRSMLAGALPWDAARTALDLVRYRRDGQEEAPTVRLCKWVWRLRLASPSIPMDEADHIAVALAALESASESGADLRASLPHLPYLLAYEPWCDDEHRAAYDAAVEADGLPKYGVQSMSFTGNAVWLYLEERFGPAAAHEMKEKADALKADGE